MGFITLPSVINYVKDLTDKKTTHKTAYLSLARPPEGGSRCCFVCTKKDDYKLINAW